MNFKFSGLATQLRELRKRFESMDTSKEDPTKVRELRDLIKDLEEDLASKKKQKEERAKAKATPPEAPKVEAAVVPTEVVKESAPAPTEEVVKEADVNKFAIDSRVEPIRGTAGSVGVVIREAGVNGDPLCYVRWTEGTLKEAHGEYGAYYPSDLRLKAEVVAEAKDPTAYVPREQLYNLEADLKSNYERMIADLHEEIKLATDKGEAPWAHRLEEKLAGIQKAYDEKYSSEKQADSAFKCENCGAEMGPLTEQHLENLPSGDQKWTCNKKKAEDENGSGGTNKLKVYDMNPPYEGDPQEKAIGYGGDRPYGAMTAPNGPENSLPLEGSKESEDEIKFEKAVDRLDKKLMNHELSQKQYDDEYTTLKKTIKASLKLADLDLDSVEKRWALYVDGKLAIRTLTRSKAERIAKEKFPEQVASGKYEIKREDHVPVEAALNKQAINVTIAEKLFVVNPMGKTADNEFGYDVNLADGSKLFKITSADEMGQEHLAYVIEKELLNEKVAATKEKCEFCKGIGRRKDIPGTPDEECRHCGGYGHKQKKASLATLTTNLAFLKKGSLVSILDVDNTKKQIKFASLDHTIRGWAPMAKFAAMNVPEAKLVPHEGHKDEVLAESGMELLVSCPSGSNNVVWRKIEAPPATPESLNPDVASLKEAAGCDQCDATMINGVFCHETGCPNARRERKQEEGFDFDIEGSLNKEAHIRHEDGKWIVYNHDYKKKLGTYDTKEEALKRLRQIEYFKHQGSLQPLSKKETVQKKADQEISLEQQVQGFKDRMSAVTERLSNPPVKQASEEETSKGEAAITTSEVIESLERGIDLLEGKTSDQRTPEQHHNLEEMENLLWKVEDSLGLSHPLPEHEMEEPEHASETKLREPEFQEPTEKESKLEVKADDVNTPPPNLPPAGFRYSWDPKNMTWILVQITGAPGGGQ